MMMKALEAGGMPAEYDLSRNTLNEKYGDSEYIPNGGGFYELSREAYEDDEFPDEFKGKLIKCLFGGMFRLKPGKYKVIFMMRDPEEIRQSYSAFFNQNFENMNERYHWVKRAADILDMRSDVDVTRVWYRDAVDFPRATFDRIVEDGWPIDVEPALQVVNPDLCRFRLENLEAGIAL